jgi:glycosyltransferase involved in cell wall biosynthesis
VGTEAFPGVVLEAFACGKPVIASALDGIPEAFAAGNYGQLVQPEAMDELAAAMEHWARQPRPSRAEQLALHERLGARFSLDAAARNVLALYSTLLPSVP